MNNIKLLFFLVKHGCDLNIQNKENKRPLDIAIDNGNMELAAYISKLGNYTIRREISNRSSINKDLNIINFDRVEESDVKQKDKKRRKKIKTEEVDVISFLKEKFDYKDTIKNSMNYLTNTFTARSEGLKKLLCKTVKVR
jgi:hypothetical protein